MHFRILKMIATSGFLAAFECTKFVFGRGSAPDPAEAAYSAPQTPLVTVLLREREEGIGEERRGGRGEEGRRDGPPNANSWICPWV